MTIYNSNESLIPSVGGIIRPVSGGALKEGYELKILPESNNDIPSKLSNALELKIHNESFENDEDILSNSKSIDVEPTTLQPTNLQPTMPSTLQTTIPSTLQPTDIEQPSN